MIAEAVKEYVLVECKSSQNAFSLTFFEEHLSVVAGYARRLGDALGADLEIVELAGWLHDISAVQDIAALPRHPRESGNPFTIYDWALPAGQKES